MKHQNKVILGGLIGNLVEAYDVSICYFLSQELTSVLMGRNEKSPMLILTLIFIAYLAKPIGAFGLGLLSDLYGRKTVLMGSILCMGISTFLIGLIPSYAQIGSAAIFLLLVLRITQNVSLGSEFLNSASFLVESGDRKQRGFRGCWPSVGVKAGFLLACVITQALFHYFPSNPDWLWRIPFLLAIVTTLVGFYVRYNMPESLAYVLYYADREKPTTKSIYKQSSLFVKRYPFLFSYAFFASFLSVATGFFFYLYIPLHSLNYSHLSHSFIMLSTALSLVLVAALIPLFGWLSDKYDRLSMLSFATIGLLVLSYPFMQAVNSGHAFSFMAMQLIIGIPCACYYSVSSVLLTELFPMQIRCTALSIVFSIAASLAAGVPPLLAEYLIKTTGLVNAPSFIVILSAIIVLSHVRVLFKRVRTGKNEYVVAELSEQQPVFHIHYHLVFASIPNNQP